jgi:uncharacterized protein YbaP (TraB family)
MEQMMEYLVASIEKMDAIIDANQAKMNAWLEKNENLAKRGDSLPRSNTGLSGE